MSYIMNGRWLISEAIVGNPTTGFLDFGGMYASADRACGLLKVLANPDRLVLLCRLAEGERCVSELESSLEIRQPTLSQQLGVLREEGLVATRRDGKHIYYRITSPESIAIIKALQEQFCKPS
jgi:DNA-binding transcriptional ArsR family regulator